VRVIIKVVLRVLVLEIGRRKGKRKGRGLISLKGSWGLLGGGKYLPLFK